MVSYPFDIAQKYMLTLQNAPTPPGGQNMKIVKIIFYWTVPQTFKVVNRVSTGNFFFVKIIGVRIFWAARSGLYVRTYDSLWGERVLTYWERRGTPDYRQMNGFMVGTENYIFSERRKKAQSIQFSLDTTGRSTWYQSGIPLIPNISLYISTVLPNTESYIYMPALIIQIMAFTQIITIWTPAITPQDHLKVFFTNTKGIYCMQNCECNIQMKTALFSSMVELQQKNVVQLRLKILFVNGPATGNKTVYNIHIHVYCSMSAGQRLQKSTSFTKAR